MADGLAQSGPAGSGDQGRSARAVESRRKLMLEQIIRAGSAQVEELASRYNVSRMTVHRDLDALVDTGIIRKQHGGVTLNQSSLAESSFSYRIHLAERQKAAIAKAASALVHPGHSVVLDESTTTLLMAPHLSGVMPLTIMTNGMAMIERVKDAYGLRLIALGGTYNPHLNAFFGLTCATAIASLRANILFMSTSAVLDGVVYHQDEDVLVIKRALMAIARVKVLMVDSSKFGTGAVHRLAPLDAFDHVITDDGLPDDERTRLRERGIALTVAVC